MISAGEWGVRNGKGKRSMEADKGNFKWPDSAHCTSGCNHGHADRGMREAGCVALRIPHPVFRKLLGVLLYYCSIRVCGMQSTGPRPASRKLDFGDHFAVSSARVATCTDSSFRDAECGTLSSATRIPQTWLCCAVASYNVGGEPTLTGCKLTRPMSAIKWRYEIGCTVWLERT